jgi:hypothetical protein
VAPFDLLIEKLKQKLGEKEVLEFFSEMFENSKASQAVSKNFGLPDAPEKQYHSGFQLSSLELEPEKEF